MTSAANPSSAEDTKEDTTGDVRYAFVEGPADGELMEILPGIHWVRIPLPIRLRIVNCWWLEEGDGTHTAIDTGFHTPQILEIWQTLLQSHPVSRLLITHHHPDHFGLAGWLQRTHGLVPLMPQTEWIIGGLASGLSDEVVQERDREFLARGGMDEAMLVQQIEKGNRYARAINSAPSRYLRIADGDTVRIGQRDWQVVTGSGHSPEMAMLYSAEDKLFISADQVLPKITPNTSIFSYMEGSDPLGDFVETLSRLKRIIPDDVLVLPSHHDPFYGLHSRIDTILDHHEERLAHALEATSTSPVTAMDVCDHLFGMGTLDSHQRSFAYGEALAHVVHLVRRGHLSERLRDDGVMIFQRR